MYACMCVSRPKERPLGHGHPAIALVQRLLLWNRSLRADMAVVSSLLGQFPGQRRGLPARAQSLPSQSASANSFLGAAFAGETGRPPAAALAESARPTVAAASPAVTVSYPEPQTSTRENLGATGMCDCSGNCGNPDCTFNQNANRSRETAERICSAIKVSDSKFCLVCECEVIGCHSPKSRQHGCTRWRIVHARNCAASDFATKIRGHTFHSAMTMPQRFVARANFCLPHLDPEDYVAWNEVLQLWCPPGAGSDMRPHGVAVMFLAHAIKYPPMMRRYSQMLLERAPDHQPGALVIAQAFWDLLVWSNGQRLPSMHKGLSGNKRSHASSGLIMAAMQLGMFESCEESRKLELGLAGTEYALRPFDKCDKFRTWIEALLVECQASQLRWPSQGGDLEAFANHVLPAMAQLRDVKAAGVGLTGAAGYKKRAKSADDDGRFYTLKHVMRYWIISADRASLFDRADSPTQQRSFDELTMAQLSQWLPDRKSELGNLKDRTAGWIRDTFGVDPLFISCHLCFAQILEEKQLKKLTKIDYADLHKEVMVWRDWRKKNPDVGDCFPPTLLTLGEKLAPK